MTITRCARAPAPEIERGRIPDARRLCCIRKRAEVNLFSSSTYLCYVFVPDPTHSTVQATALTSSSVLGRYSHTADFPDDGLHRHAGQPSSIFARQNAEVLTRERLERQPAADSQRGCRTV